MENMILWKKISETSMEKCPQCQGDKCLAIEYAITKKGSVMEIYCFNPNEELGEIEEVILFFRGYMRLTARQRNRIIEHCIVGFHNFEGKEQEEVAKAKSEAKISGDESIILSTKARIINQRILEVIKEKWDATKL